jgi:hypothetical protein
MVTVQIRPVSMTTAFVFVRHPETTGSFPGG